MTRYLVTGGAGFIGSHLVSHLVKQQADVRVIDNLSTGRRDNIAPVIDQVDFREANLLTAPDLEALLEGVDVVFHQAALPSVPLSVAEPLRSHEHCLTATVRLLDACRKTSVRRVVYAASSSAYGERPELPKREDQLPQTVSPYAAAKLAGEYFCAAFSAAYGLETVALRYFNVYGPRQDPSSPYSAVIPLFVTALTSDRRPIIFGDGGQSRDFVYVDDVVQANLRAAEAPGVSGKVFNVGTGNAVNLVDLLTQICELTGRAYDPDFQPPRPGDVRHSWADISAARDALGYEPQVDLATGLRRTVNSFLK